MAQRSRSGVPLPTGTVTFLFTDIEGSTRLLHELGDAYDSQLARHAAILRRAIDRHDGVEVNTEGDAFFAVFTSPLDALQAAVQAQRQLDAEPWIGEAIFRVRMGIHTGDGRLGGDDYTGMDVHRAARVASAAHGGQILLSHPTHGLLADRLPDGLTTRDLGRYQLKDLPEPEHLYQLEGSGLGADFPPLRRPVDTEAHLPLRRSSIVGRAIELAELEQLLEQTRLLTLTGAGGAGKTTLALEIARRCATSAADGAWFIDLAGVREPADVRSEIARGLGLHDGAVGPASERLLGYIAER
jgi:class 3 adenylate cyclase